MFSITTECRGDNFNLTKRPFIMYLVTKINQDGTRCSSFTLDLEGLHLLFKTSTPNVCSFEIARIS